uniref:non-specific serine/threonine protein kinase n=1 Tax=Parascaris equorum TaxID=6256 RepID=A0A914RIA1_PAREQ
MGCVWGKADVEVGDRQFRVDKLLAKGLFYAVICLRWALKRVECHSTSDVERVRREIEDEAAELCSMPYRAPELFVCAVGSVIDQSVDIWLILTLLSRPKTFTPFRYSSKLISFMRSMLKVEPKERPNIRALCEMICQER